VSKSVDPVRRPGRTLRIRASERQTLGRCRGVRDIHLPATGIEDLREGETGVGTDSATTGVLELDPIEMEPREPLPSECRDDLPCRVHNSELWFAEVPADLERAKALCRTCPALVSCLSGALQRREPWGVWGGEIFQRGVTVARKRSRGRPRKSDAGTVAA
jgi:WhiB family transcriptional regulator, redox-sensing transcriptional regulator